MASPSRPWCLSRRNLADPHEAARSLRSDVFRSWRPKRPRWEQARWRLALRSEAQPSPDAIDDAILRR
jgi:hypothetical protein